MPSPTLAPQVRITALVGNTYHARVHYGRARSAPSGDGVAPGGLPAEVDVDARPSGVGVAHLLCTSICLPVAFDVGVQPSSVCAARLRMVCCLRVRSTALLGPAAVACSRHELPAASPARADAVNLAVRFGAPIYVNKEVSCSARLRLLLA